MCNRLAFPAQTHLPGLAYDTNTMPRVVIESQPIHTGQCGFILTRSKVDRNEDAAVVQPDLDVVRARTLKWVDDEKKMDI